MKCADCKFWRSVGGDAPAWHQDMGRCHRRAPCGSSAALAVVIGSLRNQMEQNVLEDGYAASGAGGLADLQAKWPATYRDDFCGEFVAAKGPGFV